MQPFAVIFLFQVGQFSTVKSLACILIEPVYPCERDFSKKFGAEPAASISRMSRAANAISQNGLRGRFKKNYSFFASDLSAYVVG